MVPDHEADIPIWMRSTFAEVIGAAMAQFWTIAAKTPLEEWDENSPALLDAARKIRGLIALAEAHVHIEEYKAAKEQRGTEH